MATASPVVTGPLVIRRVVKQRAHHAEGQEREGPEPKRQEDGQESAVAMARVAATVVGVQIRVRVQVGVQIRVAVHVEVGVRVRISVTGEQELHRDGADTDDQGGKVEDPHALS